MTRLNTNQRIFGYVQDLTAQGISPSHDFTFAG